MHEPLHISLPLAICLNTHSSRWNIAESILGVFEKLNSLRLAAIACSCQPFHFWLAVKSQGLQTKYLKCAFYLLGRSKKHPSLHTLEQNPSSITVWRELSLQGWSCLLPARRSMGARVPQHLARAPLQMSDKTPRGSCFERSGGYVNHCCSNKIAPIPDLVFSVQLEEHVFCLWFLKVGWPAGFHSFLLCFFFCFLFSIFPPPFF